MKALMCLFFHTVSLVSFSAFCAEMNQQLAGNQAKEFVLFVGNPGVGKSAIINSLLGKHSAKSGISPGSGLTKFFSAYEHDKRFYCDTPGLSDISLRKQAASEIENALKKNGRYRIFFIITLESGRVKTDDITTINIVMDSIKTPEKKFNVIINKVTKKEIKIIFSDAKNMAAVYASINSQKNKTGKISYIPLDRALEDDENENLFLKLSDKFHNFIHASSNAIDIKDYDVGKIKIDQFETIKEALKKNISALEKKIEDGNKEFAVLLKKMEDLQDEIKKAKDNPTMDPIIINVPSPNYEPIIIDHQPYPEPQTDFYLEDPSPVCNLL